MGEDYICKMAVVPAVVASVTLLLVRQCTDFHIPTHLSENRLIRT